MYRGKRSFPKQVAKAMDKEIDRKREGEEVFTSLETPFPTPRKLQPPRKVSQAERARVLEMIREEGKQKKHGFTKVHKRTTPGKVDAESPPADAHREGKRWIKNLVKQNRAQRDIDTKRFAKKR